LRDQVRSAELYAESEQLHNPKKRAVEQISVPTNVTDDPVMIKITKEAPSLMAGASDPVVQISLEDKDTKLIITDPQAAINTSLAADLSNADVDSVVEKATPRTELPPLPPPFRDPEWEKAESSYLNLAISNLNTLTRSYNLMAPDLAKKPYYSLERELKSCYADVAPQLPQEIIERARAPVKKLKDTVGAKEGGIMERFATNNAKVYDSKRPPYGFRELWRDLFKKDDKPTW